MASEIERRYFVSNRLAVLEVSDRTTLHINQGYIPKEKMNTLATDNGHFLVFDTSSLGKTAVCVCTESDIREISEIQDPAIRIRKTTNIDTQVTDYHLTIKGKRVGNTCPEFEYTVENQECACLLVDIAEYSLTKTRYVVPHEDIVIEVDFFEHPNTGLVIAEIELHHEEQEFKKPAWLGVEIPNEFGSALSNQALARNPITKLDALMRSRLLFHGGLRILRGHTEQSFSID